MATVVKDFKIKSGLIVEGTTGKINNFDILTKKQADQDFIIDLIGGETLVKSVSAEFDVSVAGELSLDRATVDAYYDAAGSADTAEDNANAYTDGRETAITTAYQAYADQAELDAVATAEAYTDGRETAITTAYQSYADQAELDAVSTANTYTDGEITTALTTAQGYANTAESNANDYTDTALLDYTTTANLDTTIDGYGYLKSADLTGYATETYVNDAVDALVDGAPGLLDTLNEIAAAINDDENYATTITTALAGKQGTLTAGDNISIVSDTISVTGLDSTDISDFATAAQSAGTGYFDPIGSADTAEDNANIYADGVALTAENNAKAYADGLAVNYDAYGSAATAEANANTYTDNAISGLDTDDIEEGVTNQYYTEERAKTDAAELLTGATLTNITITGNGSGLTITAENGVADSDTDDLTEGTNNLYFTDERAVDALQGTDSMFTTVSIDEVALQVASTLSAATAGVQSAYTWNSADYSSAEFLVKVAYGTHTEVSKVLLTLDTSDNIAITEYGIVGTNGSASSISASVAAGVVSLDVTTVNNNSTVTVVGTLLA
jgi:hypothetical protein